MSDKIELKIIILEPFFTIESNCCICNKQLFNCKKGIPMYEGIPVPFDWEGEWGGMDACDECFDAYENKKLKIWKHDDLKYSQECSLSIGIYYDMPKM